MKTTYHRDRSVTIWNVYTQQWEHTATPSDRVLASCEQDERAKILHHVSGTCRYACVDDAHVLGAGQSVTAAIAEARSNGYTPARLRLIEITPELSRMLDRDPGAARYELPDGVYGTEGEAGVQR